MKYVDSKLLKDLTAELEKMEKKKLTPLHPPSVSEQKACNEN